MLQGSRNRLIVVIAGLVIALAAMELGAYVLLDRERDQRQEHAITPADFDSVAPEATRAEVEDRFGEPDEAFDVEAKEGREAGSCISYWERGAGLLQEEQFRFCFTGETLSKKNRF